MYTAVLKINGSKFTRGVPVKNTSGLAPRVAFLGSMWSYSFKTECRRHRAEIRSPKSCDAPEWLTIQNNLAVQKSLLSSSFPPDGFYPRTSLLHRYRPFFKIGTWIYTYLLLLWRGAQKLAASMVSRHTEAVKRPRRDHRCDSLNLLSCVYICSVLTSTGVCIFARCNFETVCTLFSPKPLRCVYICSVQLCVQLYPFARCPSEAAVDPATVTLANVPANIFVFFNTL